MLCFIFTHESMMIMCRYQKFIYLICFQICQLHSALEYSRGVILYGASAAGKTTCYRTLSKVLTKLNSGKSAEEKDEIDTDKELVYQHSQKLKVC